MKIQRLFKLVALLVFCCVMFGCGKQSVEPVVTNPSITIFGTVFNKINHEPVIGVEVEIGLTMDVGQHNVFCDKLSSSVSGTDGQFELQFGEVDTNGRHFYIWATCNGYEDYFSTINVDQGGAFCMDINLDPK